MNWNWSLLRYNCTGCGICSDVCPEDAISQNRGMSYPEPVLGKCTGCMICLRQCPFDAIKVVQTIEK